MKRSAARAVGPIALAVAPTVLAVVGMGLLFDLLAFAFPAAISAFLEYAVPARSRVILGGLVVMLAGLALVRAAFLSARTRVMEGARAEVERRISHFVFQRVLGLELPFYAKRSPGDLAARVQAILSLRDMALGISQAGFDLLLLGVYFALLFAYQATLAGVLCAFVLLRLVVTMAITRQLKDYAVTEAVAQSDVAEVFSETLGSAEAVKALHMEQHFMDKLDRARAKQLAAAAQESLLASRSAALVTALESLSGAALLMLGGWLVMDHTLSLGGLSSFLAVEALVAGRTASIAKLTVDVAALGPAFDRLDDVIHAPLAQAGTGMPGHGELRVQQVSFAFEAESTPVLKGVSLVVQPGQHVALVGRSGSGKSTLLKVMCGLLRPAQGQVTLAGAALETLDQAAWRAAMGYVPAHNSPFDGTFFYNVALDSGASEEDVWAALRAVELDSLVKQRPGGLQALLKREQTGLSTGQTQRLMLARALVKKPRFLFLDEATSALDEALELRVLAHLGALGATTVSATHRNAVMRSAHHIVVVEGGHLVASGTYAQMEGLEVFRQVVS